MILENIRVLVNDILVSIRINLLLQCNISLDDIKQLVCQIVLGSLIVVLNNARSDLRRRDGKNRADHPVGAAPIARKSEEIDILVCNTPKETKHILNFQNLARLLARLLLTSHARGINGSSTFNIVPLSDNARNSITHKLARLPSSATVLCLLTAAADVRALIQYFSPTRLTTSLQEITMKFLVNQ